MSDPVPDTGSLPERPDLTALTEDLLVELTNAGTVRRARREQSAGRFSFAPGPGGAITATDPDADVTCVLGSGPFDSWTCSCAAGERCRHLVRAVLDWQVAARDLARDRAPSAGTAEASDRTALFSPRTLARAESLSAAGIIASVTVTDRLSLVRLLYPEHLTVRFLLGRDPRYARCECDTAGCVHLALALEALQQLPDPGHRLVSTVTSPVSLPDVLERDWSDWLTQLLELGLPAAAELLPGAIRLASRLEQAGAAHPAAALREVAEQLELRLDHSSRLAPDRLLELIGEVTARLRTLRRAEPPVPPVLVAGTREGEVAGGRARLAGLGAEYRQVGGWHLLRCYLLETRTCALRTVTIQRADPVDGALRPADLAMSLRGGVRMLDFAAARGLLPSARRVGDELVLPRGRWSVAASPSFDLAPSSPALAGGFAGMGDGGLRDGGLGDGGLPSALGPRRPADGIGVALVTQVEDVRRVRDGTVSARVVDPAGQPARLELRPDPRTGRADEQLAGFLTDTDRADGSPAVSAIAGRWRRPAGGGPPTVEPTALWSDAGMLLPQLGILVRGSGSDFDSGADLDVDARVEADLGGGGRNPRDPDVWADWWDELAETLGRLLTTGARRGAGSVQPLLRQAARSGERIGLIRTAGLVRGFADQLTDPSSRLAPFTDLAVLLALRS